MQFRPADPELDQIRRRSRAQRRLRATELDFRRAIVDARQDGLSVKLLYDGEELDLGRLEVDSEVKR